MIIERFGNKWDTEAPIGSIVVYNLGTWHDNVVVTKIIGETKTQFKLKNGSNVRKSDGHVIGYGYTTAYIPTAEQLEKINTELERKVLVRELQSTIWKNLPIDILRAVREIIG